MIENVVRLGLANSNKITFIHNYMRVYLLLLGR